MAKNRSRSKNDAPAGQGTPAPSSGAEGAARPALWLRLVLSGVVVWHVFVVFISPLAVEPSSLLVARVAYSDSVRWYSDSLYLNHGYHFFGPDPPINQLVRYRVTNANGETIVRGEFPSKTAREPEAADAQQVDAGSQWPRLYYHRHMMLADQASLGPPDVPADEWLRLTLRAYGRHLLRRHEGDRVEVDLVRHLPMYPSQARKGEDPNSPGFFQAVVSIEETAASLTEPLPVPPPPAPPAETNPAPSEALPPLGGLP